MKGLVGETLSRYKILAFLGEGSTGGLYQARDTTFDRDVAIWVAHSHYASLPNFHERFLKIARPVVRLDHPGLIPVYDFDYSASLFYIVMKFIPGENLKQILHDLKAHGKWIAMNEAVQIVQQVALALDYAHDKGVFHLNIHPGNIMFEPVPSGGLTSRPVISDLGMDELFEGDISAQIEKSPQSLAYLSPEQALGKPRDARSAVYTLGVLLFELTTGQLPFPAETFDEAIRCHTQQSPPDPRSINPDIPEPLERVILRAMEKQPEARFQTTGQFARSLEDLRFNGGLVDRPAPSVRAMPGLPSLVRGSILVYFSGNLIQSVTMESQAITVGREPDNDIVLDDRSITRHHARIEFDGGLYMVTDLSATNGTFLDGRRLKPGFPGIWRPWSVLQVGEYELRLEIAGAREGAYTGVAPSDGAEPRLPEASPVEVSKGLEKYIEQMEPGKRFINAQVENHPVEQALKIGEVYTLAFSIDIKVLGRLVIDDLEAPEVKLQDSEDARGASILFDDQQTFQPKEDQAELTVYLSSKDFILYTNEPQKLIVPRVGRSKNKARFDIEPKHAGVGEITALFYKYNNFIQGVMIRLQTGESLEGAFVHLESLGRSPEAAFAIQPRDVSLLIKNAAGGFDVTMVGAVAAEATLPLTLPQLDKMIARVRMELLDVVYFGTSQAGVQVYPRDHPIPKNVTLVYQAGIDIPLEANQLALRRLAKAGYLLYQEIFFGPNANAAANLLGEKLIQLSKQSTLRIQIVSQQFLLPWGLLYLAEDFDPNHIDPECFLGLKHIIEHIPLQQHMAAMDNRISSRPKLGVSLYLNQDIDRQLRSRVVADQLKYWGEIEKRGVAQVKVYSAEEEISHVLAEPTRADQIIYFYCHAEAKELSDPEGPGGSYLDLGRNRRLSLDDLKLLPSTKRVFMGLPIVFINACDSAQLSPLFYDGFMPFFVAKGARGLMGTECEIPAKFAAEWARRFFDKFLLGNRTIGQVFLELRREFYYRHNNLLGLLYALYCDGDTQIVPGLPSS